jgi:hypothetical protein
MRVLLLHPEDFPQRGPWSQERWDLIVDLGRSSSSTVEDWERIMHVSVLRADSLRQDVEDLRQVRKLFSRGMDRLTDEAGIDWWELTSLLIMSELETILAFQRLLPQIERATEIWATHPGWPASAVGALVNLPLRSFFQQPWARFGAGVRHYGSVLQRFPARKIKEIVLDKYDSRYKWRARFVSRTSALQQPCVLVPSAYVNVSRMAAAYAELLPQESFLVVATRQSGRLSSLPPNVQTRDLAAYVEGGPPIRECEALLEEWTRLKADLRAIPEFAILSQVGVLDLFPRWFQDGLVARNAWRKVLEREPVCGVLCGDDSNRYTRLPVILAAKRGIPTVDFHHGAMDGRYLVKDLPCDRYLAKNAMEQDYLLRVCGLEPERLVPGAPALALAHCVPHVAPAPEEPSCAVFFSEPYETSGARAEEVYREILPRLCRIARESDRHVIVKLHPFESLSQRTRMLRELMSEQDFKQIAVVEGPLLPQLLSKTWFGLAVESTTVLDCFLRGIPSFVCGWLTLSPFGYVQQYARSGIAHILRDASDVERIPELLAGRRNSPPPESFAKAADPESLRRWLGVKSLAANADVARVR